MNSFPLSFQGAKRLLTSLPVTAVFAALVFFAGVTPTPVQAQSRFFVGRGFGGGRSFGPALGFGLGLGLGAAWGTTVYGGSPYVTVYAPPPTVYYVPQAIPQSVVVTSVAAPSPAVAPAAPAPVAAAAPAPTAGKMSRIVYDANGKPMGVLVLKTDGSQEYVPLAP